MEDWEIRDRELGVLVRVELAGERVELLGERALFWARERTLFVADPHFGKADAFQAAGVPVPSGASKTDLARLSACVTATAATRLVVLGDFFHAKAGLSEPVLDALAMWRARHAALEVLLVGGNHDRHAGPPPPALNIATVDEPHALGPFACCHHPPAYLATMPDVPAPAGYVLAGHEHPVAALRDVDGTRHRFPCFHLGAHAAVLPAFGTFTGGHTIRPVKGDRVYVVCDGAVLPVTTV